MRSFRFRKGVVIAALLAGASASGPAFAHWPDDYPIQIVIGYAPGSATDTMARSLIPFVQKRLSDKAKIILTYKPGASGEIGYTFVQHAKPDGYTIGTINIPGFLFSPMYKKTSYQPDQLALIARLVSDPTVLVGRADAAATTLDQIVRAMKASPGKLSFGNNGVGTNGDLAFKQLEQVSNTKGISVPFKGAAEQSTALLGKQIDYCLVSASEATVLRQSQVKVVAQFVAKGQRSPLLPNVPTADELGYPAFMSSERGLAAPMGTDPAIIKRLDQAIQEAMNDPAYRKIAVNDVPVLAYLSGDQWRASMKQTAERLRPLVKLMPTE